jgi:nucleotide-binding universal stress UspA family protein
MALDTIHQCPRCELRFAYRTELEDHLRTEHVPAITDDVPARAPAVAGIITVPVDPTGPPTLAVPIAAALARQAGMGVEIVASPPRWVATPSLAAPVQEALAAGAPRAHGELLTRTDPAAAIVDHVGRGDRALVCMATRGRSPVGQLVLGSVSAAVVRSSPVPVLLVGPEVRAVGQRLKRLVACLDGSPVAERALPIAAELAQRLSAELVLIQVVVSSEPAAGDQLSELAYLHDTADRLSGPPPLFEVLRDRHPVGAIAGYGGDRNDTIIVMATHGRSGLGSVVMGSIALGVTHEARCPVLVVPPHATSAG